MKPSAGARHSTVSPCLMVESISEELRFLEAVFGAKVRLLAGEKDRAVWQAQVQLGDTVLKIGRVHKQPVSGTGMLYVWTEDVDAACARAVRKGASLISAPIDQPWGVREAGFRDPQGNMWWIGKKNRKPSNREVERRLTEQRRKRL